MTGDDRMIAGVILAVGLLRVTIAVASGEVFGAEATLAVLMIALGGVMLRRRSA
jgi:uncharacterized protein (TIGR03382 family)